MSTVVSRMFDRPASRPEPLPPPVACSSAVYAVVVSSEVIAGKQEVICAHIERLTEPISLTVALEVDSSSTVLLEEPVAQPFYRCLRFQV